MPRNPLFGKTLRLVPFSGPDSVSPPPGIGRLDLSRNEAVDLVIARLFR
jgi:hypothetical protein